MNVKAAIRRSLFPFRVKLQRLKVLLLEDMYVGEACYCQNGYFVGSMFKESRY